jgi:tetratricopeptide (TPR) repeat protein
MEGMFRAGMQALKAGDMETAIRAFREMLSVEPGLVRVRLELGRALFTAKQYSDASDEFTLALSGKLPDEARQYVLQYLRTIEARSDFTWDFSVGFGLAPELFRAYQSDTLSLNFLGAPLEFTLKREDEDARLAISVTGSAEYRKEVGTIGEDTKVVAYVHAGADGTTRDVNPQDLRTLSLTERVNDFETVGF